MYELAVILETHLSVTSDLGMIARTVENANKWGNLVKGCIMHGTFQPITVQHTTLHEVNPGLTLCCGLLLKTQSTKKNQHFINILWVMHFGVSSTCTYRQMSDSFAHFSALTLTFSRKNSLIIVFQTFLETKEQK